MLAITLQRLLLVEVKSDQSSFLQFSCSLLSWLPPRISGKGVTVVGRGEK